MAIKFIASLLALAAAAQAGLVKRVACAGSTHTAINGACCLWFNILDDIQANLLDGICGEDAHEAIRLTFHDAIGFSPALARSQGFGGGGADGSIITFSDIEQTFAGNLGTEDMADTQKGFADAHGVSYGDIIQFVGAVALSNCAGGPHISFLAGRPNATGASPPGLLPDPTDNIPVILNRFADAGFTPQEVVALVGSSHSTAAQDHVDPTVHGSPFDSTPSSFDTQIFIETQLRGTSFAGGTPNVGMTMSAFPGEMRLLSDHLLARDPATACFWQALANNHNQMVLQFTAAMNKLALLGQPVASLLDCSEVIPTPQPATVTPHLPAGVSQSNIEQACATAAFPILPTTPGPLQTVPVVPPQA